MKAKHKIKLLLIVLLFALAAMSFTALGIPSYTKNLQNKSCTNCHVTAKATDIPRDSRNKAVSYAIAKGVFPVVNKKFGANKYITGDELKAAIQRAKESATYSGGTANLTRTQLAQAIFTELGINYSDSSYDSEVNSVKTKIANYTDSDRALALAVARGIIPVVAKTKTGLYAVKGYATRADAAYAITLSGLIQTTKAAHPANTALSDAVNIHPQVAIDGGGSVSLDIYYRTYYPNPGTTKKIAEFCLYCHDDGSSVVPVDLQYSSIKNMVYSTHYLQRTYANPGDGTGTLYPGMFSRI